MIDAGRVNAALEEALSEVESYANRISQVTYKRQAIAVLRDCARALDAISEADDETAEDE